MPRQNSFLMYGPIDWDVGGYCHSLAKRLFPICRSITGPGTRETLKIISEEIGGLSIKSIKSGTRVFDWTVPDEWEIRSAYITDSTGRKIVDFNNNNLHVVGYSESIDKEMSLEDLEKNLFSIPEQPTAIPYVTSYYSRRWGFCLTHEQRKELKPGMYKVYIDSTLRDGEMNYGEVLIPGQSEKEIFISTYVCHPSMANNELSGPVVTAAIIKWLKTVANRYYSYRVVFIPETIGSIAYLSENLEVMKERVFAGFNITCVGDDRSYSYLPSRNGSTISDVAAKHVLKNIDPSFKQYSWLDRGSDERQYCSPGVDLPIASIMRSKYGEYPEYHTSLDDFSVVTPSGLQGGFDAIKAAIEAIENNFTPVSTVCGEPQLGKRGLYPTISAKGSADKVRTMMNMLSYCDGEHTLLQIADIVGAPIWYLVEALRPIIENGLVELRR